MKVNSDNLKNSTKRIPYPFVMIVVIVLCFLLLLRITYSAYASDSFFFMDFQASIDELLAKVERASPGVVMIVVYDNTGTEKGKGSGFFIDRKGRILTNANVIKDAYSAEVFSESNHYNDVTILKSDEDIDLALLKVKATNEIPLEFDFEYKMSPDERVFAIGKSRNLKATVSEGLIIDVVDIEGASELIKIKPLMPISSLQSTKDGPLLNQDDKVIGVMTSTISEIKESGIAWMTDDQSFKAISIRSIQLFLSKPDEKIEHLQYSKSRVWSEWLISRVKTVAITSFIFLFGLGFPKIIGIVFAFILFISLIQWIYIKLMKKIRPGK